MTRPAELQWLHALCEPTLTLSWSLAEWQRVVRVARRLRLLARLAHAVQAAALHHGMPQPVQRHLIGEMRVSAWRTAAVTWALQRVGDVIGAAGYPCVLLKGAAYLAQDLPIAAGRLPSDLDILVPQAHLTQALQSLTDAGWQATPLDAHDQRYYFEWSHEVPPMRHPQLNVELDLHHNILPPVARTHVSADALLARLQPSKWSPWQVLAPVDQVLHSASHLFLDSEARDRLRDIVDLDGLMRHFSEGRPAFWDELQERAAALGLSEMLALGVHFSTQWLDTPVPDAARRRIAQAGPPALRRAWMMPMFSRILMPTEPDAEPSAAQTFAATMQLVRYHRQRLPLRLLVPHVWHKMKVAARPDVEAGPR